MAYTFTRTGAQIEEIHNTVEDPKSNSQFSDDIRTIAGEYRGLWPDTGGSANKGDTYQTQVSGTPTGQYFTALQNTTVDPVSDDVNWRSVVSDGSLGNFVNYQSDNVSDMIIGVTVNGSVELIVGQVWQTKSFYSSGNSGASYVISSGLTENGATIIDIDGSLSAKLLHNGSASILQAGSSTSEGANITNAILGLIDVGVKEILIPLKSVSLTSNVDLQGAKLVGIDTIITGAGSVYGGILKDVRREAASSVQKISPSREFSTSRTTQKVLIKTSQTGGGHSSPYGETYSIISPSSYGGVARFDLINGVGGSGATDSGAPWDRLRCINSYLYDGGFAIKSKTSAESSGVTTSTLNLNNFYPNGSSVDYTSDGVLTNFCRSIPDSDWVEYVIPAGSSKANIAIITSAGSTSSALVEVNGRQVADVNCIAPDNRIVITEIDLDIYRSNTIRITNNGGFAAYVAGVNLISIDRLTLPEKAEAYIDKVCLMSEAPVLYSGTGASIDSVVVLDGTINAGSYHGGETAVNLGVAIKLKYGSEQETIYATTSVGSGTGLNVGDMRISNQILVRNRTTIAADNNLYSWIDFDFSIDGGCSSRVAYYPSSDSQDVSLTTIYTGMHSTDRSLSSIDYKSYSTSDNTRTEIPPENFPCVQTGGSAQVMYSPIMSDFSLTRNYLNQVWNASPYLKLYTTPVESTQVKLKGGDRFIGGCLYQYGKAII